MRRKGPANHRWKGGRYVSSTGYVMVQDGSRYRKEHILIVEKALGKSLPPGAVVHHVDGDKTNNTPSNLVVCQDAEYHRLLHFRARALEECGNADWAYCRRCKQWDAKENLLHEKHRVAKHLYVHRLCKNAYQLARYYRKKATASLDSQS